MRNLGKEIRRKLRQIDQVERAIARLLPSKAFDAAEAREIKLWAELHRLEQNIPSPPQSFADVVLRAEIAAHGAERGVDGVMAALTQGDCFSWPAARLIEAVLQMARK